MDYISIHLQGLLERSRMGSERYWDTSKLIHQYLLDALRAEVWWRLKGMSSDMEDRTFTKALVAGLSLSSCMEIQQQLRDCLPVVFPNDREQQELFGRLLDQMDAFAALRSDTRQEYTLSERCRSAVAILEKIDELRQSAISFPPLSDGWEIYIPLHLECGMWQCATYQKNPKARSMYNYLWDRRLLSSDAAEYNDGPLVRSDSRIQSGRVYFRCGTRMRCLYPFVQVAFDGVNDEVESLWLFQSLERPQNGGCRGIDIMRGAEMDHRAIPELVQRGSEQNNRYITLTDKTDAEGNTCPLRNRYNPNYPDWCEGLETINSTIRKLKENLNTPDCSLIYLYGAGGVGKTAAVQKLLEEFDVPKKHHEYEHIIFLSAKQLEWSPTNGQTTIMYDDSKGVQSFQDLPTLRRALRNILSTHTDGEAAQVPQQWAEDREQLYSGKSILLVLDDYESISPESQQEIVSYLMETFYAPPPKNELLEPSGRFKRRQVIITCRESSIECLRADVLLPRLDMNEIICLAKHFARRFGWLEAYDRAFGVDGMVLSDAQERKRAQFHDLSYGKPLMILSLVRNYCNADFPEKTPAENELLDILTRDTGRYLGRNDLCQALAVMAAYLADENGRNTIERLRFLWSRWSKRADYLDRNLELLRNYSVLQVDNQELHFVFTSNVMQMSIVNNYDDAKKKRHDPHKRLRMGFGAEQGKMINLPDDLLRMAQWLRRDQQCSIEECLMYRLQRQIELLYDPSLTDEFGYTDSDIGCLADVVLLEDGELTVPKCEYRKTLQMVLSVYQYFDLYSEVLYTKLSKLYYWEYPAEQWWGELIAQGGEGYDTEAYLKSEQESIENVRKQFRDTSDPADRFAQLWAVLRVVGAMKELRYPISEAWGDVIEEQLKVCMRKHDILSKTDLELLRRELREAEYLFRMRDFRPDSLTAARWMTGRQDQECWFFKVVY